MHERVALKYGGSGMMSVKDSGLLWWLTGDGELGFVIGEGAEKTVLSSKKAQQELNYPIPDTGGQVWCQQPRCARFYRPPSCRVCALALNWLGGASGAVTLKKLECSKKPYALYTIAWDKHHRIPVFTLAFGIGVMINRDSRGHSYYSQR
ncbi:hypothetical protein Tco_0360176 [Tanacetum coccineum]